MVVTEEEAKLKWCKDGRMLIGSGANAAPVNRTSRYNASEGFTPCLGKACMSFLYVREEERGGQVVKLYCCGAAPDNSKILYAIASS